MFFNYLFGLLNYLSFLLLLLVVGCRISTTCNYYTKHFSIFAGLFLLATETYVFGLFHSFEATAKFLQTATKRYVWFWNLRFHVEGADVVDRKRAHVVVLNHQHALDCIPAALVNGIFDSCKPVAKKEVKIGPFGGCVVKLGGIFINRAASEESRAILNDVGRLCKEEGSNLLMFVEGTRNVTRTDDLLPFKKGAFHVAINNGLPILPVVVSKYDFIDSKRKIFKKSGAATIKVLEPIETNEMTTEDLNDLVDKTRNAMVEAFREISHIGDDGDGKKNL